MPRRDDNRDLRRGRPSRDPLPRILVVCEGAVTEQQYLNGFRITHGASTVRVQVESPGGDPKALVEKAIELREAARAHARRTEDENEAYDEVWCVYDVDQHARVPEAQRIAVKNDIKLAVSNSCFKLWLLLHFTDHTAHLNPKQARDRLRGHLPGYDKRLRFGDVAAGYPDAVRRARALDKRQDELGEAGGNPSTGMHRLTERILEFGKNARLG